MGIIENTISNGAIKETINTETKFYRVMNNYYLTKEEAEEKLRQIKFNMCLNIIENLTTRCGRTNKEDICLAISLVIRYFTDNIDNFDIMEIPLKVEHDYYDNYYSIYFNGTFVQGYDENFIYDLYVEELKFSKIKKGE